MGKVFSGWKRGAIYDTATGTTVQIPKIAVENTSYTIETINTDTTQTQVYGGESHTLELAFFEGANIDQLIAWSEADTPVRLVIEGGSNLQWYEDTPIKFRKMLQADKRSGLNMFVVSMFYASDVPSIYNNQNLVAYLGDVDSGTIQYPIVGSTLTLSALATGGGGSLDISIDNYAGTPISTATESISTSGIKSVTDTTMTTVYSFDFAIPSANAQYATVTTNGTLTNGSSAMNY